MLCISGRRWVRTGKLTRKPHSGWGHSEPGSHTQEAVYNEQVIKQLKPGSDMFAGCSCQKSLLGQSTMQYTWRHLNDSSSSSQSPIEEHSDANNIDIFTWYETRDSGSSPVIFVMNILLLHWRLWCRWDNSTSNNFQSKYWHLFAAEINLLILLLPKSLSFLGLLVSR